MSFFGSKKRTPPSPTTTPSGPVSSTVGEMGPVRLTAADRGQSVSPVGMSYWQQINYHAGSDTLKVALAIDGTIHVLTISKRSLEVLDMQDFAVPHSGENIYWSAKNPFQLYYRTDAALVCMDIRTQEKSDVFKVPDRYIWQTFTSVDGRVHSGMLKDHNYSPVEWGVSISGEIGIFPFEGDPDECQVDKTGRYLVIKEGNGVRIQNLRDGSTAYLHDETGAPGHSDTGYECVIGEDDKYNAPGALVYWDLKDPTGILSRVLMHSTSTWNMGYFSYCNAKPGDMHYQKGLLTTPEGEIISVRLDGVMSRKVCDAPTDDQSYSNRVKATICPLGEFALWTSRINGLMDAWLVRLPQW